MYSTYVRTYTTTPVVDLRAMGSGSAQDLYPSASGVLIARSSYRNTPELQMVTSKRQLTIGSTISISSLGGLRKREEQGAGRAGEMDGGHFSR